MNPAAQKYVPPFIVLGTALYLGWPPSAPMDLGDDLVKAKAVRWQTADLEPPPSPGDIVDPFRAVLITKDVPKTVEEELTEAPVGPSAGEIRAVLTLSGIANIGGRKWAILNGRSRLVGDIVKPDTDLVPSCEILEIHSDRITVRCQQTVTEIRPQVSPRPNKTIAPQPAPVATPVVNQLPPAPPTPDGSPPPQA